MYDKKLSESRSKVILCKPTGFICLHNNIIIQVKKLFTCCTLKRYSFSALNDPFIYICYAFIQLCDFIRSLKITTLINTPNSHFERFSMQKWRLFINYDGDDKKKRHQAKCEQTTTKKLGVRLCGMQVCMKKKNFLI